MLQFCYVGYTPVPDCYVTFHHRKLWYGDAESEIVLFTRLKKRIDKAAIDIAAKSLPSGRPDIRRATHASELLRDPELLRTTGETAQLHLGLQNAFHFKSYVRTNHVRNDTVHGRIFRTDNSWASRPMVVLIHGWNAELHYLHVLPRLARALNKAGLNAATIELPYHLHRRPNEGNGMHDFISDDLPGMLTATKQAISDIDSFSRWAHAQGCPATAVWGFSLGAWLAGLYICESDLPRAAVLTTPVADLARGVSELSFCHPIRSGLEGTHLDLTPLNLSRRTPKLKSDAIQIVQSIYDLFVPGDTYADLARAWNLAGWVREPHGHISILISHPAMRRSIRWLTERL